MAIYKAVLHNRSNTIPKWLLECIGVYVSHMNRCLYCVDHHMVGLSKQLKDDERTAAIKKALERNEPESVFEGEHLVMLQYARMLTKAPYDINQAVV
jgi:AhpD family alkylhydroperoxidase